MTDKSKCKGDCQTFIGNSSTGAIQCADCGAPKRVIGQLDTAFVSPSIFELFPGFDVVENAAKDFAVTEAKRMLADPADELGKVWDVLHAAGINSGGELSASEGVKLLAGRFTGELMDAYQALQEDFAKLKAREDAARMLLHDASVSLYAKGVSQYEQPRVAMIAWLEE